MSAPAHIASEVDLRGGGSAELGSLHSAPGAAAILDVVKISLNCEMIAVSDAPPLRLLHFRPGRGGSVVDAPTTSIPALPPN